MNNTQILDMALSTISCTLVVALTYLVAKITLRITMRKTREEIAMLYDLLDEHENELMRYRRMFGPLKDWEDSEWAEKSEKAMHGSMGPDEDEDLPF